MKYIIPILLLALAVPVYAVKPKVLMYPDTLGTGTAIGKYRYLTAYHVIEDEKHVKPVRINKEGDIAIVRGSKSETFYPMACRNILWRDLVIITPERTIPVNVYHQAYIKGRDNKYHLHYYVKTKFYDGESGSPVVDPKDDTIVAIVSAGYDELGIGVIMPTCF